MFICNVMKFILYDSYIKARALFLAKAFYPDKL